MSDQKKLSDAQYARLDPLLPPSSHFKIPHRHVLDARLCVHYQGFTRRGLPREFGSWHTIYVRLNRWAKAGVLERLAAELQREALARVDLGTLALDTTIVKLHAHGAGAPKNRGARRSAVHSACRRLERGVPGPADGPRPRGRLHPPPGLRAGLQARRPAQLQSSPTLHLRRSALPPAQRDRKPLRSARRPLRQTRRDLPQGNLPGAHLRPAGVDVNRP